MLYNQISKRLTTKPISILLKFVVLLLIVHWGEQATAQTKREALVLPAVKEAWSLRSGVLVIRLVSDRRKEMTLLELAGENPSPDNKYFKKAVALRANRDSVNRDFIQEFRKHYTFSRIEFFYDYDTPKVKSGENSGFFLDPDLSLNPEINIEGLDRFVMTEDFLKSSGPEYYYILNDAFTLPPPYFPSRFRKNNFWNVFFSIFDPRIDKSRPVVKIANKVNDELNSLLNRYYYLLAEPPPLMK